MRVIDTGWRRDRLFWGILALAIALRVWAFDPYAAHHPDESFQYLEQAHRLVFGYGLVPWEFRYFIRSWLIPLMLAGPMQIGEWLNPGGTLYLVLPRATIAAINIAPVVAAWFIAARVSRPHAIVAMAVVALWVESVLFSVQTLSESLAIACFLPAAALARAEASRRALLIAGALFAMAGLFRFQYAPAIAVYVLLIAGRDWRMWRWLIGGAVPVVILGAAIDVAMGLTPYSWIVNNYIENIGNDRMRKIGGVSHSTYVDYFVHGYLFAGPFIILLSFLAGRRFRALLIAAWVNILFHQLIGHKEWRYLWFSINILLLLAAIGSVNATRLTLFGGRLRRPRTAIVTAGVIAAWGATSLAMASTGFFREDWRTDGHAGRLAARAARDPRVCGLGVHSNHNVLFPFAFIHRPIPVYVLAKHGTPRHKTVSLSRPGEHGGAFNAVVIDRSVPAPAGFPTRVACAGRGTRATCLYTRPGGCKPTAADRAREHQTRLLAVDM